MDGSVNEVIQQVKIRLNPRPRGFQLITKEIVATLPGLASVEAGLCNLFLRHTSASRALLWFAIETTRKSKVG